MSATGLGKFPKLGRAGELAKQVQDVECLLSSGHTYDSLSLLLGGGVRPETVADWGAGNHLARRQHRRRLAELAEEVVTGVPARAAEGAAAPAAVNLSLARPAIRRGKLSPEERELVDLMAEGEGLVPGARRAATLRALVEEAGLLKSDFAREIQVPEKVLYAYLRPANLFRMALPTLRRVLVIKRLAAAGYFAAPGPNPAEASRMRSRAEREVGALEREALARVRAANSDPVRACLLGALGRRNLSQRAGADKAGISHPTMNGIIHDPGRRINEHTVRKLIEGLGLDGGEEEALRAAVRNRSAPGRAAAPAAAAA